MVVVRGALDGTDIETVDVVALLREILNRLRRDGNSGRAAGLG